MKEQIFENIKAILINSAAVILAAVIPVAVQIKLNDFSVTGIVIAIEMLVAAITALLINFLVSKKLFKNGWLYFFVIGLVIVIVTNRLDFWTTMPFLLIINSIFVGITLFIYTRLKSEETKLGKLVNLLIAIAVAYLIYQLPLINSDPNKLYGYFGFLLAVAIISHFAFIKNRQFAV